MCSAMFDAQYERIKLLGQGSYGAAYLVRERSSPNVIRVAKEIPISHLTAQEQQSTLAEAGVLSMMSHSNIVAYVATFCEGPKLHIVMEYADGGDLAKKISERKEKRRTFSEREIMFILVQLALALQHIHARNILHRDLKPLNIFLTKLGVLKLGDFGIAKVLGSTSAAAQTVIGTPHYLSPEMCNNEPYGTQSDLWSLGVVTYELAALRVPFHAHSLPVIAMKICSADPAPLPQEFSTDLSKIVFDLLKKDAGARLSLDSMLRLSFVQAHIRALLLHSCECNSGGCEDMVAGCSVSPLKEQNKPRDDMSVAITSGCPSASRVVPENLEITGHTGSPAKDSAGHDDRSEQAKEAIRQEFFRNRRAAMEAKQRAQGVADILNTQKGNRTSPHSPKGSSSQQVVEVRRRSQEERRQREAVRWSELENARQEMRKDVEKLQQLRRSRETNPWSNQVDCTLSPERLAPTNKKMCVRCDESSPVTDKENLGSPAFLQELSESDKARQQLVKRNDEACFSPPWRIPRAPHMQGEPGDTSNVEAESLRGYVADNEFNGSNTHYQSMPTLAESTSLANTESSGAPLSVDARGASWQAQSKTGQTAETDQQLDVVRGVADDEILSTSGGMMQDPLWAVKSGLARTLFTDSDVLQLQVVLKTVLSGDVGLNDAAKPVDVGSATLEYSTISAAEELEQRTTLESSVARSDATLLLPSLLETAATTPGQTTGDSADHALLNTDGRDFLTPDCTGQLPHSTKFLEKPAGADDDTRLPVFESAPVDLTDQSLSAESEAAGSVSPSASGGFVSPAAYTADLHAAVAAPLAEAEVSAVPEVVAADLEIGEPAEPLQSRKRKKCCTLM